MSLLTDPRERADYYTRFAGEFNLPGAPKSEPRTAEALLKEIEAAAVNGPAEVTLKYRELAGELERRNRIDRWKSSQQPPRSLVNASKTKFILDGK
jgi:hypothetical protein